MRWPEPTRKRLLLAGGGLAAVVLVVASAFSCTRTEPELGPAAFRPTTTITTTLAPTSTEPGATAPTSTEPGATAPTTAAPTTAPTSTEPGATAPTTAAPTTAPATATTEGAGGVGGTGDTRPSSGPEGPGGLSALPARTSEVATVRVGIDEVSLHDGPTGGPTGALAATGDYGQRQVFLVVGREGGRLHVLLPTRPNGSKAWIDASDVDVTTHDYQIQVSISEYRLMAQKGTEVVVDTPIGVGTQDTPTVGGEFYTWVLIDPTNSGYGSYAYGLSGFSTLEQFNGGDGRMGVHGTTDDSSIGRSVSHGCIRVPDDVVVDMVEQLGLPLGVPVTVYA